MLLDYPEREYPEPEDPALKGKKDPKAKVKKKKKEPPFPLPAWAEELTALIDKIAEMRKLAGDKDNLKLDDPFLERVGEQMKRFKMEVDYRRELEEYAR